MISQIKKKLEEFCKRKKHENFFDGSDDFDGGYRDYHWEVLKTLNGYFLDLKREMPNYDKKLTLSENLFLDDLEYSENRITYAEDMNYLIEMTPKMMIEKFSDILMKCGNDT